MTERGIYAGLDVQDSYVATDANEIGYRPRPRDMDAHPMLVLGMGRKNGMLEGTHQVVSAGHLKADPDRLYESIELRIDDESENL